MFVYVYIYLYNIYISRDQEQEEEECLSMSILRDYLAYAKSKYKVNKIRNEWDCTLHFT